MKKYLKHIFVVFALTGYWLLVTGHWVFAQDIRIAASVNRNSLGLDEQLELNVNVSGAASSIPDPNIPALSNFTVYSSGRSQNISIVNGKVSSSVAFRYVLVPKTTGKSTIPPISVEHEGSTYQTQPIEVEVTGQGQPKNAPQSRQAQEYVGDRSGEGLFITASLDKPSVYVNEQVSYIFRFYRRVQLLSNPQYVPPDLSGFWTDELAPKNYYATVNGQRFLVTEVKTLLFPTKPGAFTLGYATLQCSVQDINPRDPFSDDFFSSFFAGGRNQTLHTKQLSLRVLPLPDAGKPADFGGATGRFIVSAGLDKSSVKANEPVTLTVTVSGTGNIKTISQPRLPQLPDFRTYDTVNSLNIEKDDGILKGSKTFKTVIVPQTPGRKTIAPLVFSFFDPVKKEYQSVTTKALSLEVKPGDPGAASAALPSNTKAAVTVINQDISFIKAASSWKAAPPPLYRKPWFLAANAAPLLFLAFAFVYRQRQERLNRDVAYARRRRASGTARKYLKQASKLLKPGSEHAYYCSLSRALLEYIADKLNVSADGLTSAQIAEAFSKRKVGQETLSQIKELLDECDLVRFAPTQVTREMMEQVYERVEDLITKLEKEFK